MTRIRVTPIVGHAVPKPDGTPLNSKGEDVREDRWWRRRERDGDVKIEAVKGSSKTSKKAPAKPAEES